MIYMNFEFDLQNKLYFNFQIEKCWKTIAIVFNNSISRKTTSSSSNIKPVLYSKSINSKISTISTFSARLLTKIALMPSLKSPSLSTSPLLSKKETFSTFSKKITPSGTVMHKKLFANLMGMTSIKPNHKLIHKKSFPHQ